MLDGEGRLWMANPFSAVPTAFRVQAAGRGHHDAARTQRIELVANREQSRGVDHADRQQVDFLELLG